jgi:esterase/lipase superfamily enzyme
MTTSAAIHREQTQWFSPALHREMEILVFGHAGTPVLVFPTSQGGLHEFEEHGMIDAVAASIEKGRYRLVCVDSVDAESWLNHGLSPRERVVRHSAYERYVLEEALPFVRSLNGTGKLWVAGCGFGGYHAVNFTLRHPDCVDGCLSISGSFDVRSLMPGFSDVELYYHNPVEYLPNLTDEWFLHLYRTKVEFILATGEWDFCLDANLALSKIFDSKGVRHWLDVWGDHTRHDWPWWQRMIHKFLA